MTLSKKLWQLPLSFLWLANSCSMVSAIPKGKSEPHLRKPLPADGYGRYTWVDGSKYDGYWKNGKREGEGTNEYANGDVYKGQWP